MSRGDEENFFGPVVRQFRVGGELALDSAQLTVAGGTYKSSFPLKIMEKMVVTASTPLTISFGAYIKGLDVRPHQTFIQLSHLHSELDVTFVAKPMTGNREQFLCKVDVGTEAATFLHQSGEYSVEILVGDPFAQTPLRWELARVVLDIPPAPQKLQKSLYTGHAFVRFAFDLELQLVK